MVTFNIDFVFSQRDGIYKRSSNRDVESNSRTRLMADYFKPFYKVHFISEYCCFKLWYNANQVNGSLALIYTGTRDPRSSRSLIRSTIVEDSKSINLPYLQLRTFYTTPTWRGQESSSKVEDTVKNIKEQKEIKDKAEGTVAKSARKDVVQKTNLWQKVKAEIIHYYHGFRLLGLDMKISAKLVWRILKGRELSRREHRLVNDRIAYL